MSLQTSGTLKFSEIHAYMGSGITTSSISFSSFRPSGTTKARGVTGIPNTGMLSFSNFYGKYAIPIVSGFIAKYTGESFTNGCLIDETYSGYNTSLTYGSLSTAGSTNNGMKYIYGTTSGGIQWPSGILPGTYTLLYLSRYNGSYRNRILQGVSNNWLSGHWGSNAGIAYHGSAFVTPQIDYYRNTWVLGCDQTNSYRANRIEKGTSTGQTSGTLAINQGGLFPWEGSDFALYCVYVYNRELSSDEMLQMENYLNIVYKTLTMHTYNYYSLFNRVNSAGYTITQTGSNPNIQLQMNATTVGNSQTSLWYDKRIQDYSQFVVEFDLYISGDADGISFFTGYNQYNGFPYGEQPATPAVTVRFQLYTGIPRGVYLYNGSGTQVASYLVDTNTTSWIPVRITYTKGTSNTWNVVYNETSAFTYSDSGNATWLSSSGGVFGFGCRTGGAAADFKIRKFTLSIQD